MKQQCIGITRIAGVKNSNPYDMARLVVLVPAESRTGLSKETKDPYTVTSFGHDTAELDMTLEAFVAFKDLKFPIFLEVETDSEIRFGRLQSVVTGYTLPQQKAA